MSQNIINNPVTSYGLNQMTPAIVEITPELAAFGPIGTAVAIVMMIISLVTAKDYVPPPPVLLIDETGDVTVKETGEPVNIGNQGPMYAWSISLASNFAKLMAFFSNGVPDYSNLDIKLHFEAWSSGNEYLSLSFGPYTTPITYGAAGPASVTPIPIYNSDGVMVGSTSITHNAVADFNSTKVFWNVLRLSILNSNAEIDAGIRTILEGQGDDKTLLDAAIAQRKNDLILVKANLADMRVKIADLEAQHKKLQELQDDDLAAQLREYLTQQIDAMNFQYWQLQTASEPAQAIAATDSPKIPAAVPWLLFASLLG